MLVIKILFAETLTNRGERIRNSTPRFDTLHFGKLGSPDENINTKLMCTWNVYMQFSDMFYVSFSIYR